MDMSAVGRWLVAVGAVLVAAGLVFLAVGRLTGGHGWRLPGDLVFRRDHVTIYFPLATSLLVSLILTVVLAVLALLGRR